MAAADTINLTPKTGTGFDTLQNATVGKIVPAAITIVLVFAGIIFFFMLVYGGIKWIMSGGDKANTESARSTVTAALIGLVIVFAAWAIGQLIGTFFGVDVLQTFDLPDFIS